MPGQYQQQGEFLQADFFNNSGGLNLTDSPFVMDDGMATGGFNYEYALTGGIRKRLGHPLANATPDAQLKSLAFALHVDSAGTKTPIRAAGTKLQAVNPTTYVCTNLTEDTVAAASDFLANGTTVPVVNTPFMTATNKVVWFTGGGITGIYGAYSATKATQNGCPIPTSIAPTASLTLAASGTGGTIPAGTYYYGVALRKRSTQAISNVDCDKSVAVSAGNNVTVTFNNFGGIDATKYDAVVVYRSQISGVSGFTAGDIMALILIANVGTPYTDNNTFYSPSVNVPRANNTILDNSVIPTGQSYKCITAFKRRLVAASGNTFYLSDVNKPEAWPTANAFTIPSAGDITALGVISFSTQNGIDEMLVIFKQNELWVFSGTGLSDWQLKFIDNTGCLSQPLLVSGNGYLAFLDYRGIYMWDGSGKPIYASRMLEDLFRKGGDIDKTNLAAGWGAFFRKQNEIVWVLPHIVKGTNQFMLKLDLRLSIPNIKESLGGRVIDAVFIQDSTPFPVYAGMTYIPNTTFEEQFLVGDASGNIYSMFDGYFDGTSATGVDFSYETKYLDLSFKSRTKRIVKVIVWTEDSSDALLALDWWMNYKTGEDDKSTESQPASGGVTEALWDLAYWDAAYWNQTARTYSPVVFNLNSTQFGTEGDCIKLRFRQSDANAPVTIAGFTIIFTLGGLRK